MASPGGALGFQDCCEQAGKRPHAAGLTSLGRKFLTICVILCSMSFAGCARDAAQREVGPVLHEGKASPSAPRSPPPLLRTIPIRRTKNPATEPGVAHAAARPRLRVQAIRPQDGRSGRMGPPEDRVRTAVLPGRGESRARAPRAAADIQHMRNRAGPATKAGPIAPQGTTTSQVMSRARAAAQPIRARLRRAFRELYVMLVDRHPPKPVFCW